MKWKRGKYLSRKVCKECSHTKSLEVGMKTRQLWKEGKITRTEPLMMYTTAGMVGPNYASKELVIQRFIEAGIYMTGVLTQQQVKGMLNIGGRTMRNWLNRFYPDRQKWGLGGRFKEREKDIICLQQDLIKDKDIKEFVKDFENISANNPIMKAIHLWNKKVKLIKNEGEDDEYGMVKTSST